MLNLVTFNMRDNNVMPKCKLSSDLLKSYSTSLCCECVSGSSICLFVCLSHYRIFNSYEYVIITGEGLHNQWPLSSKGSLACHTYCDTGYPFIMVISENPWHLHLLPSVWQWSCHYLFLRLRSVAAGIRTPNLPHARLTL